MIYSKLKQSFMNYLENDQLNVEVKSSYMLLEEPDEPVEVVARSIDAEWLPSMAPTPLEDLLEDAKQSISLGAYIREKAFRRKMVTYQSALFEQAQISRDYWSRLLNDEVNASKEKLMRVAILLKLSLDDAEELLEKAGYSLSQTILRDVVVSYCLRNRIYDFVAIESLLEDHEVQSLFNDRRGAFG